METKTFKNRFLVVLGVISLLWVTMAVSSPRSNAASAILQSKDAYRDVPLALAFSSREGVSTPYRLANGASSLYSPDHSQQTFVFIHGFGGQAEQWQYQLQKSSLENRVIALDPRERSDKPNRGYDMPPN